MKARCPYCEGGDGCSKCDQGYVQVGFASGDLYTRACAFCKFKNGGYITKTFPSEVSGRCVRCGKPTEWKYVGKV